MRKYNTTHRIVISKSLGANWDTTCLESSSHHSCFGGKHGDLLFCSTSQISSLMCTTRLCLELRTFSSYENKYR